MSDLFEDAFAPAQAERADNPASPMTKKPLPPMRLDDWESSIPVLMSRFTNVKIGTLFCIYKIQIDPDIEFKTVQGEALLRNIPLSGRSMHQAKVLLGLEAPRPSAPRKKRQKPEEDEAEDLLNIEAEFGLRTRSRWEPERPKAANPFAAVASTASSASRVPAGDVDLLIGDQGDALARQIRDAIDRAVEARVGAIEKALKNALAVIGATLAEDAV